MFQEAGAGPFEFHQVYHAFTAGLLGLIAVYASGFIVVGVLALINLAARSDGIAYAYRVYVGYGKVLFTIIPMLLLVSVLGLGLSEGVNAFVEAADPWRLYERAGSPTLNHDAGLPSVPLYIVQFTLFALVGASMTGLLAIFAGHFRRLIGLPLAKSSRPKEFLAPVLGMVMYLPSGGLLFMLSIGVLIGFSYALVGASMHQLGLAPESLWTSVPGLIFAIEVSLGFGFMLSLFTLVMSLGLRRTFDSWLGKWYSQGDRLIDKPPPMHLHLKAAAGALLKFIAIAAACWGLARSAYVMFDAGIGLSIVLILIEIVAFNAVLGLFGLHKDLYKLVAALTDLFGMHKLYIWTTRNLVLQQQK